MPIRKASETNETDALREVMSLVPVPEPDRLGRTFEYSMRNGASLGYRKYLRKWKSKGGREEEGVLRID